MPIKALHWLTNYHNVFCLWLKLCSANREVTLDIAEFLFGPVCVQKAESRPDDALRVFPRVSDTESDWPRCPSVRRFAESR
jgi:hypothetical protein